MRTGILIIGGKVALGPVKYPEAEAAYKKAVREAAAKGSALEMELWHSGSSKKIRLRTSEVAKAAPEAPKPKAKK